MEIPEPEEGKITIYSKSGCPNCTKAKNLLKEKQLLFKIVDCDEFLLENKEEFLVSILKLTNKEWRTFPMIFDGNSFIGGYSDLEKYVDKLLDFNVSF